MSVLKRKKAIIINALQNGEVVYMPTDTIPGLVCSAKNEEAVQKIFRIKKRDNDKPPTIIISNNKQLRELGILRPTNINMKEYWPGTICLVLDIKKDKVDSYAYLHRGQRSLAIRRTVFAELAEIIDIVGPIATSSANLQGEKPAKTIEQAEFYFGDKVDLYIKPDYVADKPSSLIRVNSDGTRQTIRN